MQTYNNRQQSPDNSLEQIEESLKTALLWLEQAYCLMNSNRLDKRYSQLYTAICDAMTATQEAVDCLDDAPDEEVNGALVLRPKEPLVVQVVQGELEAIFSLVE